ncbi:MAG TPA: CBS domain-containing protein [Micromonosporaceae bacterium]|jgi:CBS domain-containing protein|nr:CBS domain-containing protein [Micromonosporaceae bacterium]
MRAIFVDARDVPPNIAGKPVTSIMTSPVVCIDRSTPLGEALQIMVRRSLRHLAVADDAGRCLGVLSDRTVAAAWAANPANLHAQTAAAVLDRTPSIVDTTAKVLQAARLMRSRATDAVVVVDATGAAVGILTGSDLVALLAR